MHNVFVGRQPIYDGSLEVFAYELLFRSGDHSHANVTDGDQATSEVIIGTVMDIGLDNIVGTRPAFINLSRGFLDGSHPFPLSPERVVLEILEDVPSEPKVLATLAEFHTRGFTIALDDFEFRPELEPLLRFAKIVKLDVLALGMEAIRTHVERLRHCGVLLLAEKVETYEQFAACKSLGFDLFQGFFFCRPHVVKGRGIDANRLVILKLLARLQDPEVDMAELESLIAMDVALTYRLLGYINSAYFGLRTEVDSLRQALLLLGTRNIKNWASLILLARVDNKPRELMAIALVRARMCELLGAAHKYIERDQFFTVGLFSVLEALMDRPFEELLGELPFRAAIKDALAHHAGPLGETLRNVLWYEQAEWSKLADADVDPDLYRTAYLESVHLAQAGEAALQA